MGKVLMLNEVVIASIALILIWAVVFIVERVSLELKKKKDRFNAEKRKKELAIIRSGKCPYCQCSKLRVESKLKVKSYLEITFEVGVTKGGTPVFSATSVIRCDECQFKTENEPTCPKCFGALYINYGEIGVWNSDFGEYYAGHEIHSVSCLCCGFSIKKEMIVEPDSSDSYSLE